MVAVRRRDLLWKETKGMSDDGNEADLCEAFMEKARAHGWTCYPETSSWDILLTKDTWQIGVQAKLHLNVHVLDQAIGIGYPTYRRGPVYRAVLVPGKHARDGRHVLKALRLWCFGPVDCGHAMLEEPGNFIRDHMHYNWRPIQPAWIPDVVPDLPAGASAPLQLTQWKQRALRLLARAHIYGFVTSKDAKELQIDLNTFKRMSWLVTNGTKLGRLDKLFINPIPGEARPDQKHPAEFQWFCDEIKNSQPLELTLEI